jgi:CheY-like chemotaxis protein
VLVEDSAADAELLRTLLGEHDVHCDLTLVTNGEAALAYIDLIAAGRELCPNLFILDLRLPVVPGHAVLSHLRATPVCLPVPIVVFTSSNSQTDRDEILALGATRYLQKPFHLDEYLKVGSLFKELLGIAGQEN